jgi:hypothetical protein
VFKLLVSALIVAATVLPAQAGGQRIPDRYNKRWPASRLEVVTLPAAQVAAACRAQSKYYYGVEQNFRAHNLGCQFGGALDGDPICIVIYAHGKMHVRIHEEAHCWGWTGAHEK